MRPSILTAFGLLILFATVASIAHGPDPEPLGTPGERNWLPEACVLTLEVERAQQDSIEDSGEGGTDEARWNRLYRLGIDAISSRDLEQARALFCQALEVAGSFGPRDVRFAETLDELGLVAFMDEDYTTSEAMQGAAVAEMLLALGPPRKDLAAAAEESCKSSVATYMVRLGWIFERQQRAHEIDPLMREPYRILERGYVPFDSMSDRLDWLIAQYLLAEDYAAADWLSGLKSD